MLKNHVHVHFGDLVVGTVTVRELDQRMTRSLTLEVTGTLQDAPGRGVIRQPHPTSPESARVIHLPEFLRPMLERRYAEAPSAQSPLFPTATGRWRS